MATGVTIQGARYSYDESVGHFVNDKHKRIAEILLDIDEELAVLWNPENKKYAIMHIPSDSRVEPYIIFTVAEDMMDHRVIAGVLQARANAMGKPGELADKLDREEAARELVQLKETEALIEEERDKARFMWTTPLHKVRLDGKVYNL